MPPRGGTRLRAIVDGLAVGIAHCPAIVHFRLRGWALRVARGDAGDERKAGADEARERRAEACPENAERPAEHCVHRHDGKACRHRRHRTPFGAARPPDGEQQRREEARRSKGEGHQRRLQRIDIGNDEKDGSRQRGGGNRGPGGDEPRQGRSAIEGAVEIFGEARGERKEMRRRGGKGDRQRRRRHQGREHVGETRRRGEDKRDPVASDQKLGRADRAIAVGICGAQQLHVAEGDEPGGERCGLGIGDLAQNREFGKGGHGGHRHGESGDEQKSPGGRAALLGDGRGHTAPREKCRKRGNAKRKRQEQRHERARPKRAKWLQERFDRWPRRGPRQRRRAIRRERNRTCRRLGLLQFREQLAIGELRRGQVGEQDRDDRHDRGKPDRADEKLSAARPSDGTHATKDGRCPRSAPPRARQPRRTTAAGTMKPRARRS